jgi:formylglycine-generating enzyme required for sulfatase activity
MVAGRPPFRANTTVAVLKRVAEDKPRAIREIIPETPQWLCDIIAKLHEKDPDDRYQSAREVADVLADCEAQLKANARLKEYTRIPRSKPRRSGRRKWVVAAVAVLLAVIALIVTEFAGMTHLFLGRQVSSDTNKSGSDPQAKAPPLAIAPFDAEQARSYQEAWAKYLGMPVEFTNSIGMKLAPIPPGRFLMGSVMDEEDRYGNQGPQHETEISKAFYMGVYPVTEGEFSAFVKNEKYQTEPETDGAGGWGYNALTLSFEHGPSFTWQSTGFAQTDDHPVVNIRAVCIRL